MRRTGVSCCASLVENIRSRPLLPGSIQCFPIPVPGSNPWAVNVSRLFALQAAVETVRTAAWKVERAHVKHAGDGQAATWNLSAFWDYTNR